MSCLCTGKTNVYDPTQEDHGVVFGDDVDAWDWKTTIPFVPNVTHGKVIKVYDGDTITVASRLAFENSPVYRFAVRLTGIDSPEIKGKNEAEKTLAKASRDALANKILGKIVRLENVGTEKYGRLLADVYHDDLHLNKWMLESNFAIPYSGGTKTRPEEWDKDKNSA